LKAEFSLIMTHDALSASSRPWRISSKQGRKSDAEIKGRNTNCDREDLDTLWRIIHEQSLKDELVDVKAKELWVHFRRLYEPDPSDRYWRFEAHNMKTLWKFYDSSSVHHVSTQDGVDVFMLAEKEYPLRAGVLTVILSVKLRCWERTEVIENLLQRIYNQSVRADQVLKRTR
jgi:hypothetical protein